MKDELIVFVRIALYIASGWLTKGGWLPSSAADQLTSPEAVELVTGLILGAGAVSWYLISKARKALRGVS